MLKRANFLWSTLVCSSLILTGCGGGGGGGAADATDGFTGPGDSLGGLPSEGNDSDLPTTPGSDTGGSTAGGWENTGYLDRAAWQVENDARSDLTQSPSANGQVILDGDANTVWSADSQPMPHVIELDMAGLQSVEGIAYLPRQDGGQGGIGDYEVFLSADGANWGEPVMTGTFDDSLAVQEVRFPPVEAQYVRLVATSSVDESGVTAMAELAVVGPAPADPEPTTPVAEGEAPVPEPTEPPLEQPSEPATDPSVPDGSLGTGGEPVPNDPVAEPLPTEPAPTDPVPADPAEPTEPVQPSEPAQQPPADQEPGSLPSKGANEIDPDAPVDWAALVAKASGTTYTVASQAEFNAAASQAKPGDVVMVKDGTYNWNMTIPSSGAEGAPVIYTAQTPGGVTFKGTSTLMVTGNYNVIGGFVFSDLTEHQALQFVRSSDNRFSDNKFYNCGNNSHQRILVIKDGSNRNRFDYNLMQRNGAYGMVVDLPRDGDRSSKYSQDNRFDHNVFRDVGRGGKVVLQIGQYATEHTADETRTMVDHNEFINIESTHINSKSNRETYLSNRFVNSKEGDALALRSGSDKRVEGNVFEGVRYPIRAYGERHVIVNNVIVNSGSVAIQVPSWGDYELKSGTVSPSEPTGNMLVAFNTIVDADYAGIELGRVWGFTNLRGYEVADNPPFNVRFLNNVIVGRNGTLFAKIQDRGSEIRSNLFFARSGAQVGEAGSGAIVADPQFGDLYRPVAGSPLVDTAYPVPDVVQDGSGTARDTLQDIGAYEYLP